MLESSDDDDDDDDVDDVDDTDRWEPVRDILEPGVLSAMLPGSIGWREWSLLGEELNTTARSRATAKLQRASVANKKKTKQPCTRVHNMSREVKRGEGR